MHYNDKPKLRGKFLCSAIALVTWLVASNMLAMALFGIFELAVALAPAGNELSKVPTLLCYSAILLVSMFFDLAGHFTPFICFYQCRVEPSLRQAVLFSLFGRRNFGIRFRS